MIVIKTIARCTTALMLTAGTAYADDDLRGAVTAISNVAAGVAADTPANGFRWAETSHDVGPAVNLPAGNRRSGFRWATHPSMESSGHTAAVSAVEEVNQTASRWIIRNDANQAASRWIIRNDAGQAASRWIIRNDADQAASRWIIRNDADQSASRWIIRNDADQSASRWIIRNDADQKASRWIIR